MHAILHNKSKETSEFLVTLKQTPELPPHISKIGIITARIRRMGEGNIFSLFVSPRGRGGGGGTPVSGPRSFLEVPQSLVRGLFSSLWHQVLSIVWGGWVPQPLVPLVWASQTAHDTDRIRSGWDASCGHAGGLSC